jgi:hypothetical protein
MIPGVAVEGGAEEVGMGCNEKPGCSFEHRAKSGERHGRVREVPIPFGDN